MPLARGTVTDCVEDSQREKETVAASRLVKELALRADSDRQPSGPAEVRPACDEIAWWIQSAVSHAAQREDGFGLDPDWAGRLMAHPAEAVWAQPFWAYRHPTGRCPVYGVSLVSE